MAKVYTGTGRVFQEVQSVAMDEESLRDIERRVKLQPHFLGELREYATKKGLWIDVLIDSRLASEKQVTCIPGFMHCCNPHLSVEQLRERFESFVQETLHASHYYLCTMIAGRGTVAPGVRVLNRHRMDVVHALFGRRV